VAPRASATAGSWARPNCRKWGHSSFASKWGRGSIHSRRFYCPRSGCPAPGG
jgi:hypothetical protein